MEQRTELASQPLLLTIPQVATKLGLSRAMVYNLINREGLSVIHLGRAARAKFHQAKERRSRKRCLLGLWLAGRA
jgi:predicted DNA-binding transcriptional regulator AlpA